MSSGILGRPAPKGGLVLEPLDALRGVAILAVFAQHLGDLFRALWEPALASTGPAAPWLLTIAHHGWWGVDLFFVVSGFSLALGYLRAFDEGRPGPTARDFLKRRALRILPAFFVALAVVVAQRPSIALLPGFPASIAAHAVLLQGYLKPGEITLIGASWSLTTEAHFYLLMPFIAGPILRRRAYRLGLALCIAVWLSRAALHACFLEPDVYSGLFELLQRRLISSRLDQFILGILAAAAFTDLRRSRFAPRIARVAPFALAASAVLLVVAFRIEGELFLRPIGSAAYALLSLVTAAIVLSACLCAPPRDADLALSSRLLRPLAALGVVSYGVFLYHQLAIGITAARLSFDRGDPTWSRMAAVAIIALAASILAGALSWIAVERPLLRGLRRA